jgi:prepilin-type processing-associated H-X9-DG protein/prepilin-type N-terminal cleavage/methylation domain-containing protein
MYFERGEQNMSHHCTTGTTGKRLAGFTLVELLVCIGIIALLIGLLLPALNKSRSQANSTACLANLRSLGQAHFLYAHNSRGFLPNHNPALDWISYSGSNSAMRAFYQMSVKGGAGVFWCPADLNPTPKDIVTADHTLPNSGRVSYEFFSLWFAPEHGPMLSKFKGRAPLVWDVDGGAVSGSARNHKGGGNVLFADGHAEFKRLNEWEMVSWPYPAKEFYPRP